MYWICKPSMNILLNNVRTNNIINEYIYMNNIDSMVSIKTVFVYFGIYL